jgi:sugar-phosphatase
MEQAIKAVIFDLDGVIIDSNPVIEAFWKDWTDKESILLTDALIREWIHGRKVGDTIKGLFSHLPTGRQKEIEESGYAFDSLMQPAAITGIVDFIAALNELGVPTGVVTSSHHPRMLKMLVNLGIDEKFGGFVTGLEVTQGKPHPEPYAKMQEKMNLPASACLVFEDAISGIQSAVAAGMHAIGIGNENAKQELMKHGAEDVIPDFTHIRIQHDQLLTSNGKIFRLSSR